MLDRVRAHSTSMLEGPGVAGDQGRASFDDSTSLELLDTDFFGLYSVITTVTPLTVTCWRGDGQLLLTILLLPVSQ